MKNSQKSVRPFNCGLAFFLSDSNEGGFTYISLLFVIIVIGMALASTGRMWSTVLKREKEAELIFRGSEIRKGIERYYKRPGIIKAYPKSLSDLIKDKRLATVKRHLRKIYVDPMTGEPDWVLIKAPDGGIQGVKSRSGEEPYKKKNFPEELKALEDKLKYSEWEFVYVPEKGAPKKGSGQTGTKKGGSK
jgi:type II secretory pathway pseudopilin PulG